MKKTVYNLSCFFILLFLFLGCDQEKPTPIQPKTKFDEINDSAYVGGKGFTGEGWESNNDMPIYAQRNTNKGGTFRISYPFFPSTLRVSGKEADYEVHGVIRNLVYESLLKLHPNTLEHIPSLASHWQILKDHKTYRFRLNHKAKWADGTQVTTKDVIASWEFHLQDDLESPYTQEIFQKFYPPIAESKYIFHITAKELNWRLFHYFTSTPIYPAHILKNITAKQYITEYNYQAILSSGPYTMRHSPNQDKIIFERRLDYWGGNERFNKGLYNFDVIEIIIENDSSKTFERFKKGDFDVHSVLIAKQWATEMNFEEIKNGKIKKEKIYNQRPQGFSGIALNMRTSPFNDIRVRKAFTLLFNVEKMNKKHFYNEYQQLDSYFPGSPYENKNNPKYRYNGRAAVKLLREAGWHRKGKLRYKNNKPLSVTLICEEGLIPLIQAIYQKDLNKAGIRIDYLPIHIPENEQQLYNFQFQMAFISWGGDFFPDPSSSWKSNLADKENSNNIPGLKHEKIDKICDAYNKMFLQHQREQAMQELDYILMEQIPYILGWGGNFQRILYWDKFSYPEGHLLKTGDVWDIVYLWSMK